jgi:hypothetical protein
MSFYSDQAAQFQKMAQNIQNRIDTANPKMDKTTRSTLEDQQDDLVNQAEAMIAADIKGTLAGLNADQPRLAECTKNLNNAVQTVKRFDQIVAIGAAGLSLATAIASADPMAILSAAAGAEKAVADALAKPAVANMPSSSDAPGETPQAGTITTLAASGDSEEPND